MIQNEQELLKVEEKLLKVDAELEMVLDIQQDTLLNKLIEFDSMMMDETDLVDKGIKDQLYQLFFNWKG